MLSKRLQWATIIGFSARECGIREYDSKVPGSKVKDRCSVAVGMQMKTDVERGLRSGWFHVLPHGNNLGMNLPRFGDCLNYIGMYVR